MSEPSPCRWTTSTTARAIIGHHETDCDDTTCPGCQPCRERHCRLCAIEHVPFACGGCLTAVRTDLEQIKAMCGRLADEAEHSHRDGGEAVVMLAGYASPYAEVIHEPKLHRDGELHPLHVLATWEDMFRTWTGKPTILRATIDRSCDYIDDHLHEFAAAGGRVYPDGSMEYAPDFEQMVTEIRQVRGRLEDVLHDSHRAERVVTPCLNCDVRLVAVMAVKPEWDYWKCPRCKRRYEHRDYTLAQAQHLAFEGADRYVKVQDARDASGQTERVFRHWLRFGYVRSYTDPATHQVWVYYPDIADAKVSETEVRDAEVRDALRSITA